MSVEGPIPELDWVPNENRALYIDPDQLIRHRILDLKGK